MTDGLSQIGRAVAPGRADFVTDLVALTEQQIGDLQHEPSVRRLLHASIEENVDRIIEAVLTDEDDPRRDLPPEAALEYARRLGDSRVSLGPLLRAYRIGQARFTEHCLGVANWLEPPMPAAAQIGMVNAIATYIDQVCEHVTVAYQTQHERWLSGQQGLQHHWVTRLLEEDEVDSAAAEAALGYGLDATHVCVHLWTDSRQPSTTQLAEAATSLRSSIGRGPHLMLPSDDRAASLWLHTPGDTRRLSEAVANLPPLDPAIRVAVGSPASGIGGFRRTHIQAGRVRDLMRPHPAPQVGSWADLAPIAMLVDDPEASFLVSATLGDLAGPDPRLVELRATLRAFLEHHRSYEKAAAALHVHRNTVHYRIRQAEALCPLPLDDNTFALLAALNAEHWLPTGSP